MPEQINFQFRVYLMIHIKHLMMLGNISGDLNLTAYSSSSLYKKRESFRLPLKQLNAVYLLNSVV
jgi:hypothetical protein